MFLKENSKRWKIGSERDMTAKTNHVIVLNTTHINTNCTKQSRAIVKASGVVY